MLNMNDKTKKLLFRLLIFAVFAYLVFIMVSFYTSDRVGMVKLSYETTPENIITSVYATYKMVPGEGNLSLSRNKELNVTPPKNAVSEAIILSTNGKTVSEVELEIQYNDANISEDNISLVKQSDNGNSFVECEFKLNMENNTIKSAVSGNGIWFIIIK